MAHELLKSTPGQVNGTSGQRLFSTTGNLTLNAGNGALTTAVVPDGSGETLVRLTGTTANSTVGIDCSIAARQYKPPFAFQIYLDDARVLAGDTVAASSDYNQCDCQISFDDADGTYDANSHRHITMLTRGWNTIIVGRNYANVGVRAGTLGSREAGTNVLHEGNGTGGDAMPFVAGTGAGVGVTGAAYSASLYDGATAPRNIRMSFSTAGNNNVQRIFFKEMVDNFVCQSLTCNIFDDGYESTYTIAFPYMRALGIVGVVPVIINKVGTAGYMTLAQLQELYAAGWDIIPHGNVHPTAVEQAAYTQAEADAEIALCRDQLIAWGFTRGNAPYIYVSPQGGFQRMDNPEFRNALTNTGMIASFGTSNRNTGSFLLSPHFIPRMNFNTVSSVTGWAIADLLSHYEKACRNGMTCPIMLHDIVTSGATTGVKLLDTEFKQLIDLQFRLQEAGITKVVPVTKAVPLLLATSQSMAA
jgi:hypothetical protein